MRDDHYPMGTVRTLLETDLVKEPARQLLKERLEKEETQVPLFFGTKSFTTLRAVCDRLIPQPADRPHPVDLAGLLDEKLSKGTGKGWRYDVLPLENKMFETGMNGLDESSLILFKKEFILLKDVEKDEILSAVQAGSAQGKVWENVPANKFFEELLASLAELYYSHPLAKEEIGEVAFADKKGWQQIGLNQLESHEPLPIKTV